MLVQPQSVPPPLELKPTHDPRQTSRAETAPEAHFREVAA